MFRIPVFHRNCNIFLFNNFHKLSKRNAFKILCSDQVHQICLDILEERGFLVDKIERADYDSLKNKLSEGYQGLIIGSNTHVNKELLGLSPDLKIIGASGVSHDNIDLVSATKLGITVVHTIMGVASSVAELTMGMILSSVKQLIDICFDTSQKFWSENKIKYPSLQTKTLGVIGMGRVGRDVADLANNFGMNVLGYDLPEKQNIDILLYTKLEELLPQCDIISLHLPLNSETEQIINKRTISYMKKNAILVNCSRQSLVNERDLLEALDNDELSSYYTDVYDHQKVKDDKLAREVVLHRQVYCTSNISQLTNHALNYVGEELGLNISDILNGHEYSNIVNVPWLCSLSDDKNKKWSNLTFNLGYLAFHLLRNLGSSEITFASSNLTFKIIGNKFQDKRSQTLLLNSFLHGILKLSTNLKINLVNAAYFANSIGFSTEVISSLGKDESTLNYIECELNSPDMSSTLTLSCSLYQHHPLLIELNHQQYNIEIRNTLLLCKQDDSNSQVMNHVTKLLSDSNINIESFYFTSSSSANLWFLSLKDPLTTELFSQLKLLVPNIQMITFADNI